MNSHFKNVFDQVSLALDSAGHFLSKYFYRFRVLIFFFFILLGIVAVLWSVYSLPGILIAKTYLDTHTALDKLPNIYELATLENENRKTIITALGGLFAAVALYFTFLRYKVAEQGLITDRYSKAVEQLGAMKENLDKNGNKIMERNLEVRLGAIYALERIAQDSVRDHWPIMEVLTAYIRQNSPASLVKKDEEGEVIFSSPSEDIQAIITVLGRRKVGGKREIGVRLNLAYSNLVQVQFGSTAKTMNFKGADFSGSYLSGANLIKADLSDAYLSDAKLSGARLFKANLSGANLFRAFLSDAILIEANLSEANLAMAQLFRANLTTAQLNEADLLGANLNRAILSRTNLYKASLAHTDFTGAINLSTEQIKQARDWEEAIYDDDFARELGLTPQPPDDDN